MLSVLSRRRFQTFFNLPAGFICTRRLLGKVLLESNLSCRSPKNEHNSKMVVKDDAYTVFISVLITK